METKTLVDFWKTIFEVVKDRQEQGLPVTYKAVLCEDLALMNRRFASVPDLVGVEVDDDLVYAWLRESLVSKDDRFIADLSYLTLPGEEWKAVPGCSRYKVSSFGRLWTKYHGKIMSPLTTGNYYTVQLKTDSGASRRFYVHRLVAMTFLPNPLGLEQVDHLNGDRYDNRISNLEWVTRKENIERAMRARGQWYNTDAWHPGKEPKRYAPPVDTEEEQWKNIVNYPDYFVSSLGRVWSVLSGLMKTATCRVSLLSGGQQHSVSVRLAVAAAFLSPKEEGQVLRHTNGDRSDDRACNLVWCWPYKPKTHKSGRPRRDPGALLISPSQS